MDLHLNGKRALVTGSNSGLGLAIADYLVAEGAAVVLHGRDVDRTEAAAQKLTDAGGKVSIAIGDLTNDNGADAVAAAATAEGDVDILVNNAGRYDWLAWFEADADIWMRTYQANVLSGLRLIQRLVPAMQQRRWGRVITIGGGLSMEPIKFQPDYNAAQAARHNLAKSLAREVAGSGVTSNVVGPGATESGAVRSLMERIGRERGWGESWEQIEPRVVTEIAPNDVGRLGKPEEVAAAVAYLCGAHADYITGAVIRVDGGQTNAMQ